MGQFQETEKKSLIKEEDLKVVLTKYYEKLGDAGDIINVKDGYANNFLIPNNIALIATKGNIRQMEILKKSIIKKEAKNIEEAQKIASSIDGTVLKFMVNSSPEGKLYGSITNMDIAEKLLKVKKIEIDRKKIDLDEHIKEVGNYDVIVKLYKDTRAALKVEVESKDVIKEEAASSGLEEAGLQEAAAESAEDIAQETINNTAQDTTMAQEENQVDKI